MRKYFFFLIAILAFGGCGAQYNVAEKQDNLPSYNYKEIRLPEAKELIGSYREEAEIATKAVFDEMSSMERYTEKRKTQEDRFKRIMRDFKKENE